MSSCDKEVHGSGAGLLHGWYTELNEVASVARRSLTRSVARNCWRAMPRAMATPEQFTGAMNVIQRQIAELTGHQSSGIATTFPALSWNKVPVAMFSSWFSCFATDVCCCTVEGEDFVAINAGLFDEAFGRNTRTPSTNEQNDQASRRDPAHESRDCCADESSSESDSETEEVEAESKDAENDYGLLEWPGVGVGPDHYYTGQWRGARREGKGKMEHTDGSTYEGEWVSDEPCACGLEELSGGSVYKGDFLSGKRRRFGMCNFSDCRHYEGKGKNKFPGTCYHCGKVGHKAAECWPRDGASQGSSKNPSANVTSSGKKKSKGKSKGKGKSERPVDSLEFEEESGEWWNSCDDDVKPDRGGAPLGAIVVGGHRVGAELIQNCIWGDLAR